MTVHPTRREPHRPPDSGGASRRRGAAGAAPLPGPTGLDLTRLASRGVRLTPQRRAVAEVVLAASRPLAAAEVFVAAREACPGLGLTTVYRTLDLLEAAGLVRRVHGDDGCEAVVPAHAAHGHTVVCRRCGRSGEFTACDLCGVVEAASRETGFLITGHFLQLEGLCAACAATEGEPADAPQGRATEGT